jgi:hypothetical protein
VLFAQTRQSEGTTSFVVSSQGMHSFCFNNAFSTVTAKVMNLVVSFEKNADAPTDPATDLAKSSEFPAFVS